MIRGAHTYGDRSAARQSGMCGEEAAHLEPAQQVLPRGLGLGGLVAQVLEEAPLSVPGRLHERAGERVRTTSSWQPQGTRLQRAVELGDLVPAVVALRAAGVSQGCRAFTRR
jgi:hypothetical protein